MPIVREVHGDLLTSNANLLGCTVNIMGVMGAGVAKAFADRYPDLFYHYARLCRQRKFNLDHIAVFRPAGASHSVVMIPTKDHWQNPSDLGQVQACLVNLSDYLKTDGRHWHTVALPPLGCGNGGLDYESQVRPLMYRYFEDVPCQVEVWL